MEFQGHRLTELVSPEEIKERINKLGEEISKKFEGEIPIFIGVLNGSFIFMADLVRALSID
ncbi:MAG: hypoxanthine phosphoribosyltransferase, partial [Candidatus Marinimicrobia bacterium]|nr:hypoxanthine phosphoribosyltransferase [Candidatus Neomarinimicrobiota bacterium]